MKHPLFLTLALIVLCIIAFVVWTWADHTAQTLTPTPTQQATTTNSTTSTNFSQVGNLTRNNPGQKPNVWYLVYERPGAPGLSVELDLNSVAAPYLDLQQGERVQVVGQLQASVVTVVSVSPAQ